MVSKEDLKLFVSEVEDLTQKSEEEILKLEKDIHNNKSIQELFITFHTLKGITAMIGLENLSKFCHNFETFLETSKDNKFTSEERDGFINMLFESLDFLKLFLKKIKKGDITDIDSKFLEEISKNFKEYIEKKPQSFSKSFDIKSIDDIVQNSKNTAYKINIRLQITCVFKKVRFFIISRALNEIGKICWSNPSPDSLNAGNFKNSFELYYVSEKNVDEITKVLDEILEIENLSIKIIDKDPFKKICSDLITKWEKLGKIEIDQNELDSNSTEIDLEDNKTQEDVSISEFIESEGKITNIKVDIEILETMMNYFEEMVILKNQIAQILKSREDRTLENLFNSMDKPFLDIQELIFKLKLVRVDSTFKKYKRLVRDISKEMGKQINFKLEGTNVEIDRKILEDLNSPLVHVLRNAIYHGIETPKERKEKGKNEIGTIELNTYRTAGSIYIEILDDGKGIDYEKVKKIIIDKGYYTPAEAKELDADVLNQFLLMPGFSTLSDADIISGRGMGLTIMAEKIKELGGTLSIYSEKDVGTKITLVVPFTRSILKAQILEVSGDLFAIPIENIKQIYFYDDKNVKYDDGKKYYKIETNYVPVISLNEYFKLRHTHLEKTNVNSLSKIAILCEYNDENSVIFFVDNVFQQADVVVKPFQSSFSDSNGILGSAILGDGSICLILDILTIVSTYFFDNANLNKLNDINDKIKIKGN